MPIKSSRRRSKSSNDEPSVAVTSWSRLRSGSSNLSSVLTYLCLWAVIFRWSHEALSIIASAATCQATACVSIAVQLTRKTCGQQRARDAVRMSWGFGDEAKGEPFSLNG